MSGAASAAVTGGRVIAKPPSIFVTGARLPEVRWAALALVLFLVGWGLQLFGAPPAIWWAVYLACYLAGGWEPALSGLHALREKTLDVDLLMIVAAIAAASIGQVFDGALLIVIFATSGALEAIVTQRTADSVSSLLNLAPEQATLLLENGESRQVDTKNLTINDRILVRPGERIGADGRVTDGVSEVDQQAITGESVPVLRKVGDEVLSGTVNGTGALIIEVTRPASESVVARIVAMVEEASATKAKSQLFIEKVEQRYSIGVVVATLLVFSIPLLFGENLESALLRAITFMIVASPCAVVLSTMPPLLAAIANAGRRGVLVKSATAMEQIRHTSLVAFDKTGTLTFGVPEVSGVRLSNGGEVVVLLAEGSDAIGTTEAGTVEDGVSLDLGSQKATELLQLAASVEQYSEHPLGQAIVRAAVRRGIDLLAATDFKALPGRGVTGNINGEQVSVLRAEVGSATTGTEVQVRRADELLGTIQLVDSIRLDAAAAVSAVASVTQSAPILMTGDNHMAAEKVALAAGITDYRANLLPEQKAAAIVELQQSGAKPMFIGDGINDAPALTSADIGVAMGRRGSDLALESADVVVVRDELSAIAGLIGLSRKAHRFVVANLIIAAIFITVLVVWDLISTLPLPLAVAGHEGSTVIVALNGLRLLWHKY